MTVDGSVVATSSVQVGSISNTADVYVGAQQKGVDYYAGLMDDVSMTIGSVSPPPPPTITSFSPPSGPAGTTVSDQRDQLHSGRETCGFNGPERRRRELHRELEHPHHRHPFGSATNRPDHGRYPRRNGELRHGLHRDASTSADDHGLLSAIGSAGKARHDQRDQLHRGERRAVQQPERRRRQLPP